MVNWVKQAEDNTEDIRKELIEETNKKPTEREELERVHGQVWDTKQLQEDFEVRGFLAPFVTVRRRADGKEGSLMFQHKPRYYFDFTEASGK